VRAALSVAVLVALNEWLGWPPMMEAALAALLTCLCDAGGPIRKRVPPLLVFAVLGALITAGFGLARPLGYALIPVACLGIAVAGFARIYGQAAQQVGNLLTVVLVLSLDHAWPDVATAAILAAAFVGGSLWALLLTMVIWRLHPYRPARRAVAGVYRALAMLTNDLRQLLRRDDPDEAAWEEHARAHRRTVRDAIEQARVVVDDTLRARGPASARASQGLLRLETADQLFGAMIALSDLLEQRPPPETRVAAERLLRLLRALLVTLARHILEDHAERLPALLRAVEAVAAIAATLPDERLHRIADVIVERLRVAVIVSTPSGSVQRLGEIASAVPRRDRVMAPLRANLDRNSLALRHALRCGVIAAIGLAITFTWPGPYQHWLTITMVLTMQPFYGLTYQRALERIGGTVIGGGLATVLALVCRTPISIAAALFPLAVISLSVRAASFGAFMTFITPLVVLLSELAGPGSSELQIAAMRALYTVIGGLLAVGGTLWLWPSWEPDRLNRELRGAVAAHGRYAEQEFSLLAGEASADAVEKVRRAAGVASNNLEASLSRALLEPRRSGDPPERLQAAMVVDAALRRMAGRLAAMQHDRPAVGALDRAVWRGWRDWVAAAIGCLVEAQPVPPRPASMPSGPQAESLSRIARQIELMAGALRRYAV